MQSCQNRFSTRTGSRPPLDDLRVLERSGELDAEPGPAAALSERSLVLENTRLSPPASITMPGAPTMTSLPCCMSVSMRTVLEVITASVKSNVTRHSFVRTSMRSGTVQRPARVHLPPVCLTTRTSFVAVAADRSATSAASSPWVRADSARSTRASSSSAVSRPSPPAVRRVSTTRSRSSCDARSPGRSLGMAAPLAKQGFSVMNGPSECCGPPREEPPHH